MTDQSDGGIPQCDECGSATVNLRPHCVVEREEIPLLCSQCYRTLENRDKLDNDRDAEVFGYA